MVHSAQQSLSFRDRHAAKRSAVCQPFPHPVQASLMLTPQQLDDLEAVTAEMADQRADLAAQQEQVRREPL